MGSQAFLIRGPNTRIRAVAPQPHTPLPQLRMGAGGLSSGHRASGWAVSAWRSAGLSEGCWGWSSVGFKPIRRTTMGPQAKKGVGWIAWGIRIALSRSLGGRGHQNEGKSPVVIFICVIIRGFTPGILLGIISVVLVTWVVLSRVRRKQCTGAPAWHGRIRPTDTKGTVARRARGIQFNVPAIYPNALPPSY